MAVTGKGKAEIVCTGSELLSGKLNLYVPLFHEKLAPLGFRITGERSSGDSLEGIRDSLAAALRRADLVVACGGLGPTFDDLTRQAAAAALGRRIVYSKGCEKILAYNYGLKKLPPNFRDQCLLVEGAKPLENTAGTAFGQVLTRGRRKMLVLLPGPRREWEPMFPNFLEEEIRSFFRFRPARVVKLHAAGLWETQAEKLLRPVMSRFPRLDFTILAGAGTVDFLVSGDDSEGAVSRAEKACCKALGPALYGSGEETPASAAGKLLLAAGRTLACAESCTGGLAAKLITDIPGSSAWFLGSCVAYSNSAKTALLGVKRSTLVRHGAVSSECAAEMAAGARRRFGADYAFSVTGIAGPDGAAPGKPVGLVHFGLAGPRGCRTFRRQFRGDRGFIRTFSANFILDELRKIIK
ncbi:MAG: nicotinamide-nucleotide amidohydrolase family protein [Elusimicrobia bacterium]|nr:nicotinamide-nucleotide amidohydrolase family protein [Elusimicrobiota bacterium]